MRSQISDKWKHFSRYALLAATVACTALLFGCGETGGGGGGDSDTASYELTKADSCDDVRDRVVESTTEEVLRYRYQYNAGDDLGGTDNAEEGDPAGDGARDDSGSESPDDYTETNTQEEDVDEDDFVKTDGDYIYTVQGDELLIVDSWPADETSLVSRLQLDADAFGGEENSYNGLNATSMFLQDDRVAIFSQTSGYDDSDSYRGYWNRTRITMVDVSDRTDPKIEDEMELDGRFLSGRMIDGEAYAVSQADLDVPVDLWEMASRDDDDLPHSDWEDTDSEREDKVEEARPHVRQMVEDALEDVSIEEMMPEVRTLDEDGSVVAEPMHECTDLYMPDQVTEDGVLNISYFDLNDPEEVETTGLLASGWEVYASKDNLYVAMSSRAWMWGWGWMGQQDNESHIHKFGLPGGEEPVYKASGRVDGWILNQFSMDEHDGYFRVATTDNQWDWSGEDREVDGGNHVIVMSETDGKLEELSSVRDLAPGEQVFAARFMGEKAYVVTYEQVDPLFTIDLSNPKNPQMVGELKIDGFSSYIHPLEDGYLLTIGMDADSQGNIEGVHLQIFDVTDMSDPKRVQHEKISTGGWSSNSEAVHDHHAFTYDPNTGVLAIPANIHEWEEEDGEDFTGLLVYDVDKDDGFEELGRVSHGDLVDSGSWYTTVRRSMFISGDDEHYVYSLSGVGLKVNDLFDPANERASVEF